MFIIFGTLSVLSWAIASFLAIKKKEKAAVFFQLLGILIFAAYITWLWIILQRPPFKTMGETRMWYSFFLAIMGGVTYWRWKMNYLLIFTNVLATVFVVVNIFKPELLSQALMPALQSVWFIPHVAIYMFAYAVLGCAFILGVLELVFTTKCTKKAQSALKANGFLCVLCENPLRPLWLDTLVKIGATALGIGMCLGAIWAKKAWGQYWSWDIKETAALITWAIFILYIHLQKLTKINRKILLIILIVGFLSLQFTWYGVKYLPTLQKSPHLFYNASFSF